MKKDPRSWLRLEVDIFERADLEGISFEAMGLLIFLMVRQWRNGSVPSSVDALKRIVGARVRDFDASWAAISNLFIATPDGNLVLPMVEEQRAVANAFRDTRSLAGLKSQKVQHESGRSRGEARVQEVEARAQHVLNTCSTRAPDGDVDEDGDEDGRTPTAREAEVSGTPSGSTSANGQGVVPAEARPHAAGADRVPASPAARGRRAGTAPSWTLMLVDYPDINTAAFRDAWESWLAYRREAKHKPLPPISIKQKFCELQSLGSQRAVAAIKNSIGNGYSGIFEPKAIGAAGAPRTVEAKGLAAQRERHSGETNRRADVVRAAMAVPPRQEPT